MKKEFKAMFVIEEDGKEIVHVSVSGESIEQVTDRILEVSECTMKKWYAFRALKKKILGLFGLS